MSETEIRRQIDRIIEGLHAKDLKKLRQVYSPEVVSFDVEPPLQHLGQRAKLANWEKAFAFFETLTYEVRDLALTVGDDMAFGHAFARLSGTPKHGPAVGGTWVRVTYCFRLIDGDWLIAHDHVSVPLDMPSGRGVTDLEP
jgi:ketosteroid isomerase-like protein